MNGPIAQLVALVMHGNAAISGLHLQSFYPDNSTCEGCDSIRFYEQKTTLFGAVKEVTVASLPDLWFSELSALGVTALKLAPAPGPNPGIAGLLSMAALASSNGWAIESLLENGKSKFWQPRWKAVSHSDPLKREWRVTYTTTGRLRTVPSHDRQLSDIARDFQTTLQTTRSFAERFDTCVLFTVCFAKALKALEDPSFETGHYRDLAPDQALQPAAASLLKAAMNAWVFGGADSWNTLKFSGEDRLEYNRLSESLLAIINEAIVAATNSTQPAKAN